MDETKEKSGWGDWVGHLYLILAFGGLVNMVFSFGEGGSHVDLGWVILVFLGYGLLDNRNGSRIAAIVVSILFCAGAGALFGEALLSGVEGFHRRNGDAVSFSYVALVCSLGFVLNGFSLVALLLPSTKAEFAKGARVRALTSARTVAIYMIAGGAFVGLSYLPDSFSVFNAVESVSEEGKHEHHMSTSSRTLGKGWQSFERGYRENASGENCHLFWLLIVEANRIGSGSHYSRSDPTFSPGGWDRYSPSDDTFQLMEIDGELVEIPDPKPGESNLFFRSKSGELRKLNVRVTPDDVDRLHDIDWDNFSDPDDLYKRLVKVLGTLD
ncbi:MAG: hypothetical protein QF645_06705 [Planctomycetota bacterium]|nr:hypothetical protein [Planctomycetota bacterium]